MGTKNAEIARKEQDMSNLDALRADANFSGVAIVGQHRIYNCMRTKQISADQFRDQRRAARENGRRRGQ